MSKVEQLYEQALKKASRTIEKLDAEIRFLKKQDPIAVIGMACRFPGGANSPELFWKLLEESRDPSREIPHDRFDINPYYNPDPEVPGKMYTNRGNFLDVPVNTFDASFFEITPLEAYSLDPQQRLLLEVSWEAFENAGLCPHALRKSKTGVFIGIMGNEYQNILFQNSIETLDAYFATGTFSYAACGRLSYFYDFIGPSMAVDTACSSSLVGLHYACESLRSKNCDIALVGGVQLMLTPHYYISLNKFKAISPDGRCRSFSASANGYGRGEGCGCVVIKRLSDALQNGDSILALIAGSDVKHDGRSIGFTAPSGLSQERVIKSALMKAGVAPSDIDYIEAHASSTPLGDPIEVHALSNVFKNRENPLLMASVKSNIGHLEAAAGIAGLIKVILCIQKEKLPPSMHCDELNPEIPWHEIPVHIVRDLTPWRRRGKERIAGLSSFGLAGSITHVVIKEPPRIEKKQEAHTRPYHILTLSAKNDHALSDMVKAYEVHLNRSTDCIQDICYTSNISRAFHGKRVAFVASSKEDFINKLAKVRDKGLKTPSLSIENNRLVFLFTGQGSQYIRMGKSLYDHSPVFKKEMDRCATLFRNYIDKSLIELLYGEDRREDELNQTIYTQPVIFSVEYALAKLWKSFGIEPFYVLGHSIGAYPAACIAGVMKLEDAVKIVALRGKIVQSLPDNGMMAALLTSEDRVLSLIKEQVKHEVSIAAINHRDIVTISGKKETVEHIMKKARGEKIFTERLSISHAFHSPLIEPVLDQFRKEVSRISFSEPTLSIISDLTGKKVRKEEITNPDYWVKQMSKPVRFYDAVKTIEKEHVQIFIEIGGKALLSTFVMEGVENKNVLCLPSLREGKDGFEQILQCVAQLYKHGIDVNWRGVMSPVQSRKVILPNYPFQKKEFWFTSNPSFTKALPEAHMKQTTEPIKENNLERVKMAKDYQLQTTLKTLLHEISGLEISEIASDVNLFSYGFDSLMLVQFRNKIDEKYNVDIPLNKFMTDLSTLKLIAEHIKESLPEETLQIPPEKNRELSPFPMQSAIKSKVDEIGHMKDDTTLHQIINQQLHLMQKQLEALTRPQSPSELKVAVNQPVNQPVEKKSSSFSLRAMKFDNDSFTVEQGKFIQNLVTRYNNRTKKSKEYASRYRPILSDWISSLNFRMSFKEMIYPVVSDRSEGARFWDIDGNEYIDMAIGYGVHYFGHRPQFILEAIERQIKEGFELGPQTDLAGEVATLICELTGVERVAFANTGSEAVMTAIRIARTVSHRNKIVIFKGAFHGNSDVILAVTMGGAAVPASPGITQGMVEDVVVLEYGVEKTLDKIQEMGSQLAGVLVEPVQTRNPDIQPKEFLHKLRALTTDLGAALIFDEIVTGFRIHPGGCQAYFDVRADIVTYGKVIGGGFPIGIIAGKAEYLDAVDGGMWNYGDNSFPEQEVTSFAGTFCKHPITLAAARAVLTHMKEEGEKLQGRLNTLTTQFVTKMNHFFDEHDVPLHIKHFASQFRFITHQGYDLQKLPIEMELFFALLMEKGFYVWEKRICYLSTAHTQKDIDLFKQVIIKSIEELRAGGFPFRAQKISKKKITTITKDVAEYYPMSSMQKRLFILDRIEKKSLAYHITGALIVKGPLKIDRVHEVLNQLTRRYHILRTGFEIKEDNYLQHIHHDIPFEVIVKKGSEETLEQYVQGFISPFELSQPPLARVLIVELGVDHFLFAIDFHHIISDGISMGIFVDEFVRLYQGEALPPVNKHYIDYVSLEEKFFKSVEFQNHKRFWLDKLSGQLPTLNLPSDFTRPSRRTFDGHTIRFIIDKDKTKKLKKIARNTKTSLFMVLFSLFDVLLYTLTKQRDIIIGIPMSIRLERGFEQCFGMLTNSLPFRIHPSDTQEFTDLLNEIKQEALQIISHGRYPFETMVEDLKVKRDLSRNPLFDVMFSFENANTQIFKIKDLHFSNYDYEVRYAMFDMTFEVMEKEEQLEINFNFNRNLFKKETVIHWKEGFEGIIDQIIENNHIKLSDINLLSPVKKYQMLEYPKEKSIPALFEDQVKNIPDHTALVGYSCIKGKKEKITYNELNEKANQLARNLLTLGMKSNHPIGIALPRSIEWFISSMGVLKAGGTFMPLNLADPEARINYIIEKSGTEILITYNPVMKNYTFNGKIIDISNPELFKGDNTNINHKNKYLNPALIMYISGARGKPEGILLTHRNLNNFIHAIADKTKVGPNKIMLAWNSFSTDLSIFESLFPLIQGLKIVIASEAKQQNPRMIKELIKKERVTIFQAIPSQFIRLLNDDDNVEFLDQCEDIFIDGEELPEKLLATLREQTTCNIFSMVGITETTIWSSIKKLSPENNVTKGYSLIGNTQMYIMNTHRQLMPIGTEGELYIGGDGVGGGYLKNPELTEEKFLKDPYKNGDRIYKTGIFARLLPDGKIEYLKSTGMQIKIDGFRVELEEIESALREHSEIKESVVKANQDVWGATLLVAYYTAHDRSTGNEGNIQTSTFNKNALRSFLEKRLPTYMIPSIYIKLDEMPMTPYGGIDRGRVVYSGGKSISLPKFFKETEK
ncbi:MAG: aminotransferase class III-fold pyridoxal phosphate-dependent enzyme [bacterium]